VSYYHKNFVIWTEIKLFQHFTNILSLYAYQYLWSYELIVTALRNITIIIIIIIVVVVVTVLSQIK